MNLFAYCGNNPILNTDAKGNRHVKGIDARGTSDAMNVKTKSVARDIPPVRKGEQLTIVKSFYTKEEAKEYFVKMIPQLEDPIGTIAGVMSSFSFIHSWATKWLPKSLVAKTAAASWTLSAVSLGYSFVMYIATNQRAAKIEKTLEEIDNLPSENIYVRIDVWDSGSLAWKVGTW